MQTIEDLSSSKNLLKRFFYKYSITQNRTRIFNKLINDSNENIILDLGCGGGREIIKKKGKVVGIDYSFSSLKKANKIYENVLLADVQYLPFKDTTFDMTISWDLIGHIPKEHKNLTLQEMKRVLKSGGKIMHFVETEGKCKLLHFAKSYGHLYEKHFIIQDGHFGLEVPSNTLNGFNKFFEVLNSGGLYYNIWGSGEYVKRFDNKYKLKSMIIKLLVKCGKFAEQNLIYYVTVNIFFGIVQKYEKFKLPSFDDASLIFIFGYKR